MQFVFLPFLGFLVVTILRLEAPLGITLLVITSSPGGSYSNWWCSLFNADLALSVAMTAVSTIFSVAMLPLNLLIYSTLVYEDQEVVEELDWVALFVSLVIIILAISSGLFCSATVHSSRFNIYANRFGNLAGISLITTSIILSAGTKKSNGQETEGVMQLWSQNIFSYFLIASPCLFGLIAANLAASFLLRLRPPERVAVSIETCYQNIGIATSVAISMFSGESRTKAMSVPLFYGMCEAFIIGSYCIFAWKKGWTKAPKGESICNVLTNSYEVEESIKEHNIHDDITSTEMTPPRHDSSSQDQQPQDIPLPVESNAVTPSKQANADIDTALRIHRQDRDEIKEPSWIV